MILTRIQYKSHNSELSPIVKAFKTWQYYLNGYKYKVLIFTNYNNYCQIIDTISLSFYQVQWDQKLSWYHFQIDYQ